MRLLLLSALALVPSLARADAPTSRTADVHQMHTDDCARARKQNKTCVIDMGKAEDVTGNAPIATGSTVQVIETKKQPSLIRVRKDFIVEILRSADDV